jgi:AraC-like DNA-binding protein
VVDEYVRQAPAVPLRQYLAWYTGYRQRDLPPAVHRGLPSPSLTLIFTLDEPLVIAAHPDAAQPPGSFGALLGGLHTSPALITHDGAQSGIQIDLKPAGARALLGLPAGELTQLDVPADAVLGPAGARISQRLREAATWPGRFAVLDQEFIRLAAGKPPVSKEAPPEVGYAWRLLLGSGGAVPVAELAARTGWSTRHLANRFREEIGLTPKAAARVIRFDRAKRVIAAASPGTLADVAVACGYFDQAHLAREFRALAGCPPSQWLAEEFANVQAGAWLTGE